MGRTVTATTAVLLLVAGCAGPSGSTPTAVAPAAAESCAQVSTDLSAIRADVEAAAGKVPDDIPGAATQLADAVTRVQNLAGQVSDPTVADLVQNVATNLLDRRADRLLLERHVITTSARPTATAGPGR
jgi:translation initiation factor 2 gamma subunit (eIF-2gamma)